MKLVVVTCVCPPEPGVSGRVNWDIAEFFSKKQNEIILISPHPSRPLEKFNRKVNYIDVNTINKNLTHIKLNSFTYPKSNLFLRSYESWDFGLKTIKYINRNIKDADLIYATPWPFLGQFAFITFIRNKKVPVIMNVQDLYPESLFTKIKFRWLTKLLSPLKLVDRYIAHNSTHLTVVSENMKKVYLGSRNLNAGKISVIENWQDETAFINKAFNKESLRAKYQLSATKDKFTFMYLGNIGPVAGLEKVIREFSLLDSSAFALIIAGAGTARSSCMELSSKMNIQNVLFTEVPEGLTPVAELQSLADVLILPINTGADASSVPSKLIAYMFSAKPIISSADKNSDTGKVISESGCGWLVDKPEDWHKAMNNSMRSSEELESIGNKGFEYAMKRFSKINGLVKIENLIHTILYPS